MAFKILCEPSVNTEPCESSFDDPTFWQDDKSFCGIRAFDDFHRSWAVALSYRPGISAVGQDFFDERETRRDFVQRQRRAVTILYSCGMHVSFQDHAENIDDDMAFAAFDVFTRVKADIAPRIGAGFRGLRVDNRQRRAFFPAFEGPDGAVQNIVNALPKAGAYPAARAARI